MLRLRTRVSSGLWLDNGSPHNNGIYTLTSMPYGATEARSAAPYLEIPPGDITIIARVTTIRVPKSGAIGSSISSHGTQQKSKSAHNNWMIIPEFKLVTGMSPDNRMQVWGKFMLSRALRSPVWSPWRTGELEEWTHKIAILATKWGASLKTSFPRPHKSSKRRKIRYERGARRPASGHSLVDIVQLETEISCMWDISRS